MSIVSNTGPVVALAKVDALELLRDLYPEVLLPTGVHRELLAKAGSEAARIDRALADFLHVTPVDPTGEHPAIVESLGLGEQQVIILALSRKLPVLVDDRAGRRIAQKLGLAVSGTVAVTLAAKQRGLIPAVRPLLERMRAQGYWLSDELLAVAAEMAGE